MKVLDFSRASYFDYFDYYITAQYFFHLMTNLVDLFGNFYKIIHGDSWIYFMF